MTSMIFYTIVNAKFPSLSRLMETAYQKASLIRVLKTPGFHPDPFFRAGIAILLSPIYLQYRLLTAHSYVPHWLDTGLF